MSVVAVSENMGSLGIEIGHAVAASLGYQFAERDIVSKAADRFGADVSRLSHAVEERPTLVDRLSTAQRRFAQYVEAFANLAKVGNTLIVPSNISDVASVVASAMTVMDRTKAGAAGAKYLGGETNLADVMRETIERPSTVVDVTGLSTEIAELPDGVSASAPRPRTPRSPSTARSASATR